MWWGETEREEKNSKLEPGELSSQSEVETIIDPQLYDEFVICVDSKAREPKYSTMDSNKVISWLKESKAAVSKENLMKLAIAYSLYEDEFVCSFLNTVQSKMVENLDLNVWIESYVAEEPAKVKDGVTAAQMLAKPNLTLEDFREYKRLFAKERAEREEQRLKSRINSERQKLRGNKRDLRETELKAKKGAGKKAHTKLISSTLNIDDIIHQVTQKDNLIFELNNNVLELEKKIYDLQENLKEKDEVIDARSIAIALLTEELNERGKETFDKLDDTRLEMQKMQQNFIKEELRWTEENNKLKSNVLGKSKRLAMLEKNIKNLEFSRYDLSIKNAELQGRLVKYQAAKFKDSLSDTEMQLVTQINDVDKELLKTKHIVGASERSGAQATEFEDITKNLDDLMNTIAELEEEKGHLQLKLMEVHDNTDVENHLRQELRELQLKCELCTSELADQYGFVSMLENDKLDLLKRNELLEAEVEDIRSKLSGVEEELKKQCEVRVTLDIKLVELEEEKDRLTTKLESKSQELDQLATRLAAETQPMIEIGKQKVALETTVGELRGHVDDLTERLRVEQTQLNYLKMERKEGDEQLRSKDLLISDYSGKLEELEKELTSLLETKNSLSERLEVANQLNHDMEQGHSITLTSLEERLKQSQEANRVLHGQMDELNGKLLTQTEETDNCRKQIEDIAAQLEKVRAELEVSVSSAEDKTNMINSLSAELSARDKAILDLNKEMESFKLEYDMLNSEKASLSQKHASEIENMSAQLKTMSSLMEEKSAAIDHLEGVSQAFAQLKEEVASVKESALSKDTEISDLLSRVREMTEQVNCLHSEVSENERLKQLAEDELLAHRSKFETLEGRVLEEQVEMEANYKAQVNELQSTLNSLVMQTDRLNADLSELQTTDRYKEDQLKQLQDQLFSAETELRASNAEIQNLLTSIAEKEALLLTFTHNEENKSEQFGALLNSVSNITASIMNMKQLVEAKEQENVSLTWAAESMANYNKELEQLLHHKTKEASDLMDSSSYKDVELEKVSQLLRDREEAVEKSAAEVRCHLGKIGELEEALLSRSAEIGELQSRLSALTETERKLLEEAGAHSSALEALSSSLREKESIMEQNIIEINTLSENLQQWRDYANGLNGLLSEKDLQISEVNNCNAQLTENCNYSETRIADLTNIAQVLEVDKAKLLEEISNLYTLKTELVEKKKAVEALNMSLKTKEKEIEALTFSLESKEKEMQELKSQLELVHNNLAEIEQSETKVKETEALKFSLESKEREVQDLKSQLELVSNKLAETEQSETKEKEIEALKFSLESKEKEMQELKSQLESLNNNLAETEQSSTLLIDKEKAILDLQALNESLSVNIVAKDNEISQLHMELLSCNELLMKLQSEADKRSENNCIIRDYESKVQERESALRNLNEQIELLQSESSRKEAEITHCKSMLENYENLKNSFELSQQAYTDLNDKFEAIQLELKAKKGEADRLNELLVEKDSLYDSLQLSEQRVKSDLTQIQDEHAQLKVKYESSQTGGSELEIRYQEIIQSLEAELISHRDYSANAYNKLLMLEETMRNYICPVCNLNPSLNSVPSDVPVTQATSSHLQAEPVVEVMQAEPVVEVMQAEKAVTLGSRQQGEEVGESWLESEDWGNIAAVKDPSVSNEEYQLMVSKYSKLEKDHKKLQDDYYALKLSNGKYLQRVKSWKDKYEKLAKELKEKSPEKSDLDSAIEDELKGQLMLMEGKLKTLDSVCQSHEKEKQVLVSKVETLELANDKLVDMKDELEMLLRAKISEIRNLEMSLKDWEGNLAQPSELPRTDFRSEQIGECAQTVERSSSPDPDYSDPTGTLLAERNLSEIVREDNLGNEDTSNLSLEERERLDNSEKLLAQARQIEFLTEELFHLEKQNKDLQNQVENWRKHLDEFSQQAIGIYQAPKGDFESLKLELNETLRVLHQKEIHCEDLTLELTQLLEERDTLQLKLSSAIKQYQYALSEVQGYCGSPSPGGVGHDVEMCGVTSDVVTKLNELKQLNCNLEVEVSSDADRVKSHYPPVKCASRDFIGANYTVSRDSQSRPRVLLNWLVGKSTPRVMHV